MLPSNAISTVPRLGDFLAPDDVDTGLLESLEYGGTAINDASRGRLVQVWRAWIDTDMTGQSIKLSPISGSPVSTLVAGGAYSAVSLAFDSSMAPTVAYFDAGILKLRWFNNVTNAFQVDTFAGAGTAKVATDDKRQTQEGVSDVILAYTRSGNLYWRQQRDRYLVERLVGPSSNLLLTRLGLTTANRLQFELLEPLSA